MVNSATLVDVLRTHQLAADFPGALRQAEVLEHGLDRLEVVLGRHVEHGVVLVVELAVGFGRIVVAAHQVLVELAVALGVAARVHGDEAGVLQEARIDLAAEARVVARHRVDHGVLEPRERLFGGQVVDLRSAICAGRSGRPS
jgi:hypothetical protein